MDTSKYISKEEHEKVVDNFHHMMEGYKSECDKQMEQGFQEAYEILMDERQRNEKLKNRIVSLAWRLRDLEDRRAEQNLQYRKERAALDKEFMDLALPLDPMKQAKAYASDMCAAPLGIGAMAKKASAGRQMSAKQARAHMDNPLPFANCSYGDPVMAENASSYKTVGQLRNENPSAFKELSREEMSEKCCRSKNMEDM